MDPSQLPDLFKEIEDIGKDLGRKILDVLIRDVSVKFQTQLDCIKFVCTEFWKYTFSKQIDNLRTNNSGTFIFVDDSFKFIGRVSNHDHESREYKEKIKLYENFVVGLLKGALTNLGFEHALQVNAVVKDAKI